MLIHALEFNISACAPKSDPWSVCVRPGRVGKGIFPFWSGHDTTHTCSGSAYQRLCAKQDTGCMCVRPGRVGKSYCPL